MESTPSALDDPAVLNADDAVGHLGDLLVVGDHHDGLGKFLTAHLQQTQNILTGLAVQITCRFISKLYPCTFMP